MHFRQWGNTKTHKTKHIQFKFFKVYNPTAFSGPGKPAPSDSFNWNHGLEWHTGAQEVFTATLPTYILYRTDISQAKGHAHQMNYFSWDKWKATRDRPLGVTVSARNWAPSASLLFPLPGLCCLSGNCYYSKTRPCFSMVVWNETGWDVLEGVMWIHAWI